MDKELCKTHYQIVQGQFKKEMTEKVETKKCNSALLHYIPYHATIKPNNNTTKMRIVYDTSVKTKEGNKSLNECMYWDELYSRFYAPYYFDFKQTKLPLLQILRKHF